MSTLWTTWLVQGKREKVCTVACHSCNEPLLGTVKLPDGWQGMLMVNWWKRSDYVKWRIVWSGVPCDSKHRLIVVSVLLFGRLTWSNSRWAFRVSAHTPLSIITPLPIMTCSIQSSTMYWNRMEARTECMGPTPFLIEITFSHFSISSFNKFAPSIYE